MRQKRQSKQPQAPAQEHPLNASQKKKMTIYTPRRLSLISTPSSLSVHGFGSSPVPDLHLGDERAVGVLALGALVPRAGGDLRMGSSRVEQGMTHHLRPVPLIPQVPGVLSRLGA